jgi:nucleotide-binding universal stress UspA family protein
MVAIQTILHPNDLSESARPALALALRLARDHGARLIVLHVLDPPMIYGEVGLATSLPEVESALLEEHRRRLEELVAGSGAEILVVEGAAEAEILRQARETSCDLIVMGTHGRGGVIRLLLGSVAMEIVRHAPCPVLAVKSTAARERPRGAESTATPGAPNGPVFSTILHPTDFSDRARHALDLACTLARGGARLIVLYVVEEVHIAAEDFEESLNERLRELRPEDPTIAVEYRLREGDTIEEILHEADESSCDLIALGTHGRTGLGRLLLGSVAEAVLRRAGCPVLVARKPEEEPAVETPL